MKIEMKMNNIFKLAILSAIFALSSCKKYGHVVEDGYVDQSGNQESVTVDTNSLFVDRSAYAKARVFPGLVGTAEPRVKDAKLTLDLNFTDQTKDVLRIYAAPLPWINSGYYAPPGELIKLVVPEGINGLTIQIGGHTGNLTGNAILLRDPIIFSKKLLYPGTNYIRNLYGGYIYIIPAFAIPNPVQFTISGACVAPDFVLGKSNDAEWMAQVKASTVPWLELRSNRVAYHVPRNLVVEKLTSARDPLTQPTALMMKWNEIFEEHFNALMGLSDNAPDPRDRSPQGAWRAVVDIQLSNPAAVGLAGFPFQALGGYRSNEWFQTWTSLNQLTTNEPHPNFGTFHEFGHNIQQPTTWSWSSLGEATSNLFQFRVAQAYKQDYKKIIPPNDWNTSALAFANSSPSATKNFDTEMYSSSTNLGMARTVPFLQLLELYGYDLLTSLYKKARHAPRLANNDQDKRDNFYEWACEHTNTNLMPFFYHWAITVSTVSQRKMINKPMLTKDYWTYDIMEKSGGNTDINFSRYRSATASSTSTTSGLSAASLTDGNNSTYWQNLSSNSFPFTLTLDGQFLRPIKGLSFVQSSVTTSRIKDIEILSSADNTVYSSVGTFTIPDNTSAFNANFSTPVNARYFRVIIKNNYANTQTATLAELGTIQ